MSASGKDPFFCVNAGSIEILCCGLHDSPDSYPCNILNSSSFANDVCPSLNCVNDCQNLDALYGYSPLFGAIEPQRTSNLYNLCLNLPVVYDYFKQGILDPAYSQFFENNVPLGATRSDLQGITSAVTHCLLGTCDQARDSTACSSKCSPVAMLINSTTPSFQGVSDCLETLCAGSRSLPYANSDIIGIGVFCSYIMQCAIVALTCSLFAVLDVNDYLRSKKGKSKSKAQREMLVTGVVEFHKQQCFFTMALQIASFFSGVFQTDMLNEFMLMPLSTNGVLPVVFTFQLLVRYGRTSAYLSLLTGASFILSSIVFLGLYSHLPKDMRVDAEWSQIMQFFMRLSAMPSCGSYSAHAVCESMWLGSNAFRTAHRALVFLTPLIWTWSSICFFVLIGHQLRTVISENVKISQYFNSTKKLYARLLRLLGPVTSTKISSALTFDAAFWLATSLFVACLGLQFYLFWTNLALEMINPHSWGFGQIVAITIWLPPIIEYLYLQLNGMIEGSSYRLARSLAVTRLPSPNTPVVSPKGSSQASLQSTHHSTEPSTDDDDSDDGGHQQSSSYHTVQATDHNDAFELTSRPTLRMEEGTSSGIAAPVPPRRIATR